MKVYVYFNLHRKCFSIKALEGANKGRVVAHRDDVLLFDATFKVSEAGRQRVLRERKKNVHAGVVGVWDETGTDLITITRVTTVGTPITYNPYKYDTFVHLYGLHPIKTGRLVALTVSENKRSHINVWN
tara:strand:+ start:265 stop:651 length:387 start_codon:yes stop_codon:yes gene_type:complete